MQLTRTHRVLIGVVVAGAVLIAAIGFAGSYAAVRELAEEKGFGEFSVVFPIGIDAGICVLLALDLLLTWMRIPFPLLRQTAWLLTAATIAFNGAAAWPDPLGTGMHAVIPILFVVAVEAARHAVGRIADITADKHMEGVRLTRWLLSPVPTFKLWRRMKLWELRSYEQVIKLEQDRLIYQARLQARFGRNWRRKAPVESMMPLRLAKYGVPLAETAPAGLAAAGIGLSSRLASAPHTPELAAAGSLNDPQFTQRRGVPEAAEPSMADASRRHAETAASSGGPTGSLPGVPLTETASAGSAAGGVNLPPEFVLAPQVLGLAADAADSPHDLQLAKQDSGLAATEHSWVADASPRTARAARSGNSTGSFNAFELAQHRSVALAPERRTVHALIGQRAPMPVEELTATQEQVLDPGAVDLTKVLPAPLPFEEGVGGEAEAVPALVSAIEAEVGSAAEAEGGAPVLDSVAVEPLTTVDRYYLAWAEFLQQHGHEPRDSALSQHLAEQGMTGRGGAPVSPSTLRRYLPPFRIYAAWAQHLDDQGAEPTPDDLFNALAARGITGAPYTPEKIAPLLPDFPRRRAALAASARSTA
ncbi:DUF2637 domain-containing protein [Streptomyces sp. NBC_01708]|uniref:DUF2637 domain-containing protein n=1 Tax=Streptomyces sp. NBC_01708 TaxID=2975915 RepID=UPI002E332327|nr:DUF2637 domain-containing protein [Streptomyces sp. NBC_01708]